MKRVFISQPMNGKTEEEIVNTREKAKNEIARYYPHEEITVLHSLIQTEPSEGRNKALWCLSQSLEIMSQADVVYFAAGWENARGCRIEHECAMAYDIARLAERCGKHEE